MAEDITDYGATSNPNDASEAAAKDNHIAIVDAANAAGAGGTVHIPEGTFYFGRNDKWANMTLFGTREPKGINFTGVGPTKSVVGLSQYRQDNNSWLFRYEDTDHGTEVSFSDLQIDGQGRNLALQPDYSRSGRLIHIDSGCTSGTTLKLRNVKLYDAYTAGIKNAGEWVHDADRCTFERIGVKSSKDSGNGGHPFSDCAGPSGTKGVIKNSEFYRLARTVVDFADSGGGGDMRLENCWCKGINQAFVKSGKDNRVELRNIYSEHRTPWAQDLNRGGGDPELNGRHFVQNLTNTGGTFEVDVQDVQVVNTHRHGVFNYTLDSSASKVLLTGDTIVFDGMSRGTESNYNSAFDDDGSGGGSLEFNVTNMGVHNTGGGSDPIFNTPNGTGTIDTLYRSNNSGLGTTNNVTINNDNTGSAPLSPTVPSRSEVGINSSGSGSQTLDVQDDYGASGDGSTDDRQAIQDALNAASSGDTVFIPETQDYYSLQSTHSSGDGALALQGIADNVTIEGGGENAELKVDDVDNTKFALGIPAGITSTSSVNWTSLTIKKLAIDGGAVGYSGTSKCRPMAFLQDVDLTGKDVLIEDCLLKNAPGADCFQELTYGVSSLTFRRVTAQDAGQHGFNTTGTGEGSASNPEKKYFDIEATNCNIAVDMHSGNHIIDGGWFSGMADGLKAGDAYGPVNHITLKRINHQNSAGKGFYQTFDNSGWDLDIQDVLLKGHDNDGLELRNTANVTVTGDLMIDDCNQNSTGGLIEILENSNFDSTSGTVYTQNGPELGIYSGYGTHNGTINLDEHYWFDCPDGATGGDTAINVNNSINSEEPIISTVPSQSDVGAFSGSGSDSPTDNTGNNLLAFSTGFGSY